jgi:hypothetical protein
MNPKVDFKDDHCKVVNDCEKLETTTTGRNHTDLRGPKVSLIL